MNKIAAFSIFFFFLTFSCTNPGKDLENKVAEQNIHDMETKQNKTVMDLDELTKLGFEVSEPIPEGLKKGERAPVFNKKDVYGKTVDLSAMLNEGPVVLQFYRGQWCPVCSRYMSSFQDSVSMIRAKGAQVIAITPETEENALKFIESTKMDYSIINDKDLSIMDAYKVTFAVTDAYVEMIREKLKADIAENNGSDTARLPVPATYVIGKDGLIKFVQFNPNYKERASVKDILQVL